MCVCVCVCVCVRVRVCVACTEVQRALRWHQHTLVLVTNTGCTSSVEAVQQPGRSEFTEGCPTSEVRRAVGPGQAGGSCMLHVALRHHSWYQGTVGP